MKKQIEFKDQILEPLCSVGAVLMSILAMLVVLYGLTIVVRFVASLLSMGM